MTGVLHTKTPWPSVLPTHTVEALATTVVAVGRGGAGGEGEGTADGAARATVGTIVGAAVGSAVGAEPVKPGKPPHALSTIARLLAPRTLRQRVMCLARVLRAAPRGPVIAPYAEVSTAPAASGSWPVAIR